MNKPKRAPTNRSPIRLVLIMTASIFITEFGIMAFLVVHPPVALHGWVEAVLDSTVLSIVLFPLLLFTIFLPLVRHNKELEQVEKALRLQLAL